MRLKPLKIGIDARMFGGGFGIGRYVQKLIEHLERVDDVNEYVIFLRQENWNAYRPKCSNFRKVLADIPWYSWKEQVFLPRILSAHHLDLVHFPHFNVPVLYRRPFVVTIHDVTMLHQSGSARSAVTTRHAWVHWFKHACFRLIINHATRTCARIITVSRATKKDIETSLKVRGEKVSVVYEGCTEFPESTQSLPAYVIKPYVLYVGSAYPHKNLSSLLGVWKEGIGKGLNARLVVCGQEDVFAARFRNAIQKSGLSQWVSHIGPVSDMMLSRLYREATALITASTQEGFGLQLLEAMRLGTPVVCSRIEVFEEIAGDAALMFNPSDPHDILKTLMILFNDQKARDVLVRKGMQRAAQFDWHHTARMTRDIYLESI